MSGPDRLIDWWPQYRQVASLWRQGRWAESSAIIDRAEQDHPNAAQLKLVRALELLKQDQSGLGPPRDVEIRRVLDQAVTQDPENAYTLLTAALLLLDLEDPLAAAPYVRAITPLSDQLIEASWQAAFAYALARVVAFADRWDVAEELLVEAVDLDPDDDKYRFELRRVRDHLERAKAATDAGL